jgi:hypothetical protein
LPQVEQRGHIGIGRPLIDEGLDAAGQIGEEGMEIKDLIGPGSGWILGHLTFLI